MSPWRSRSGLTLIELLVSLTITGALLSAGYGAFGLVLDREAAARRMLDEASRAAAEREQLRRWIEGASLPEQGGPAFAGLDATHERLPDDALTLITTARTELETPQTVIHLFIDRDERTPERGLVARLASWPGAERRAVEVDPGVTGLDIRYYSVPLGDRGWLPSWVSSTLLPSGIEVRLSGDSLPPLLRLPILVPIGAGP